MKTALEKPMYESTEQELLEREFGELFQTTLRLEYELEAVIER